MIVEVYEGRGKRNNRWRWRLRSRNGRIVATSHEAFYSRSNAIRAARRLCRLFVGKVKERC